jgi:prepilin-type N-terminal cleavage/methylation domain-containing protein
LGSVSAASVKPTPVSDLPTPTKINPGFSILEMLIVVLIIATISGYAVVTYMQTQANLARNEAALRFAMAVEKAQHDSTHRRNAPLEQMALVKVIDSKNYSLCIDGNGDGLIDSPVVTTLPDIHGMMIKGPYPKYLRFDWLGRVVDGHGEIVTAPLVTFATGRRTSIVKMELGSKPQVVYGEE